MMRQKVARSLRKWADLIDPRVKPTSDAGTLVVNISCVGAEEFAEKIEGLKVKMAELSTAMVHTGISLNGDVESVVERLRDGGIHV